METPREFIPSINEDSKTANEEPRNEPLIELPPLAYESEEGQEIPLEGGHLQGPGWGVLSNRDKFNLIDKPVNTRFFFFKHLI